MHLESVPLNNVTELSRLGLVHRIMTSKEIADPFHIFIAKSEVFSLI